MKSPTRILVRRIQGSYVRNYEHEHVPLFADELKKFGEHSGFTVESDPARADIILLLETAESKNPSYLTLLEGDPIIKAHSERIYTINYDDHPEGFLAGAYTSLESPFFQASLHINLPFFVMTNQLVYGLDRSDVTKRSPQYLFSFAGAASHKVRQRLFDRFHTASTHYHVEHIKKWYNHDDEDRLRFIRLALDSTFCLCPRGYTSYTHRIIEVMAMGRVPVILADDWIPFSFAEDIPYYLSVEEEKLNDLPEILESSLPKAEEYAQNARTLWETYCSPERRVVATVESICRLANRGERMTYAAYRERWHSPEFLSRAGWTSTQRLALRIEQRLKRFIPSAKVPGVTPLMRSRNTSHKS